MLGVSYKTAWYLCHRIRAAMDDESAELLSGIVEADETCIGGKRHGTTRTASTRDNKTMVLGAVERGGKVRVRIAPDATSGAVHGFLKEVVADDAEAIYTDDSRRTMASATRTPPRAVNHSARSGSTATFTPTPSRACGACSSARSSARTTTRVKHLPAYLDEIASGTTTAKTRTCSGTRSLH